MSVINTKTVEKKPLRIAFCGAMGSGKTFASNLIKSQQDVKVLSVAKPIKEIVMDMGHKGRSAHIMVGMVGRQIDNNVWVDKLMERITAYETAGKKNIVVDDVRFQNEAKTLKEAGFTIVYLNTPWYVRYRRIRERTDDLTQHVKWFAHPSETAPEKIDRKHFDFICSTEEEVEKVINNLLSI